MATRLTMQDLDRSTDEEILRFLVNDRLGGLNPHGPLARRLGALHDKLTKQIAANVIAERESLNLQPGDTVVLLSMPDGRESHTYPLTVGKRYKVEYLDGSAVAINSDDPKLPKVTIWRGRVRRWLG